MQAPLPDRGCLLCKARHERKIVVRRRGRRERYDGDRARHVHEKVPSHGSKEDAEQHSASMGADDDERSVTGSPHHDQRWIARAHGTFNSKSRILLSQVCALVGDHFSGNLLLFVQQFRAATVVWRVRHRHLDGVNDDQSAHTIACCACGERERIRVRFIVDAEDYPSGAFLPPFGHDNHRNGGPFGDLERKGSVDDSFE